MNTGRTKQFFHTRGDRQRYLSLSLEAGTCPLLYAENEDRFNPSQDINSSRVSLGRIGSTRNSGSMLS